MIRLAAAGDLHCRVDAVGLFHPWLARLNTEADLFLLAGDLTHWGEISEAEVLAQELAVLRIPVVAVLGNHDHHNAHQDRVRQVLEDAGVVVLEGETTVVEVDGESVGIVGAKGFGGGFGANCLSPFGETEIKQFLQPTYTCAAAIDRGLQELSTDYKVVLLHYAPAMETIKGEPVSIYPFLGSSLLAEPIDANGADLVLHGHAHRGTERGVTAGGIPVRNVAVPVLHKPYALYELQKAVVAAHI